jgi:hypothetical protein
MLFIWIHIPGSPPFHTPKQFGVKIHSYNWDFCDRAVFPPPYSLYDIDTRKVALTDFQIWGYFLTMRYLQRQ